jgi:FkbM family methyltransferase
LTPAARIEKGSEQSPVNMSVRLRNAVKKLPFARAIWGKLRRKAKWELIDLRDQKHTQQILDRLMKPDTNAIDIGANQGNFLETIVKLSPNGKHYAFEPVPKLAQYLKAKYPQATVLNAAVSDTAGETEFHVVENNPALSGIAERTDLSPTDVIQKIKVPMVKLDDIIPKTEKIDLVKIDVEGAELNVFRGASETIKRSRPHIIFEHGLGPASCYQSNSELVYDELAALGLEIYRLADFLVNRPPLDRGGFCDLVNTTEYWNWIAAPNGWDKQVSAGFAQ